MSKFQLRCSCVVCNQEMSVQNLSRHFQSHSETKIFKNFCLECGEPTNNVKFCCRSCSATYTNSKKDYTKFKPGPSPLSNTEKETRRKNRRRLYDRGYRYNNGNSYCEIKYCPICNKCHGLNSKTCSRDCYKKYASKQVKGKTGGWRNFGGNGKSGTYKGYLYQSSWELAWIVYHLDNNIDFIRPTEYFEYEFEGEMKKYYPDFFLINSNEYVEVKGFWSAKTEAKIKSVIDRGLKITVITGKDIKPYLKYLKNKNLHL